MIILGCFVPPFEETPPWTTPQKIDQQIPHQLRHLRGAQLSSPSNPIQRSGAGTCATWGFAVHESYDGYVWCGYIYIYMRMYTYMYISTVSTLQYIHLLHIILCNLLFHWVDIHLKRFPDFFMRNQPSQLRHSSSLLGNLHGDFRDSLRFQRVFPMSVAAFSPHHPCGNQGISTEISSVKILEILEGKKNFLLKIIWRLWISFGFHDSIHPLFSRSKEDVLNQVAGFSLENAPTIPEHHSDSTRAWDLRCFFNDLIRPHMWRF